jgi:diaminopimelate decarboxylase
MSHFKYVGQKLFVENLSIINLTKKNRTPFYLYSEKQIKQNYLNLAQSFKSVDPLICFATKANTNLSILKILGKLGAGADVVSAGELLKAIKAGISPNKIVFSGVGKTEDELKLAVKKKNIINKYRIRE